MTIWQILGIEATHDKKIIKRAYAQMVKKYHPEEYPEEYQRLRLAYEKAIEYATLLAQIQEEDSFTAMDRRDKEEQDRLFMESMGMAYPELFRTSLVEDRTVDFSQLDREESIFDSVSSFQEKYNRYQELYIQPQRESRFSQEEAAKFDSYMEDEEYFSDYFDPRSIARYRIYVPKYNTLSFWDSYLETSDVEAVLDYIEKILAFIDVSAVYYRLDNYLTLLDRHNPRKVKLKRLVREEFEKRFLDSQDLQKFTNFNRFYSMFLVLLLLGVVLTSAQLLHTMFFKNYGNSFWLLQFLLLDVLTLIYQAKSRMSVLAKDFKNYRLIQLSLIFPLLALVSMNAIDLTRNFNEHIQRLYTLILICYLPLLVVRFTEMRGFDREHCVQLKYPRNILYPLSALLYTLLTLYLMFQSYQIRWREDHFIYTALLVLISSYCRIEMKDTNKNYTERFVLSAINHFLCLSSIFLGISYFLGKSTRLVESWITVAFMVSFMIASVDKWITYKKIHKKK